MINKRLVNTVKETKKYIALNVILQWISLISNISMMGAIALLLQSLYYGNLTYKQTVFVIVTSVIAISVRFICTKLSGKMSYLSSNAVKKRLRELIYEKLLKLGSSYKEHSQTSEVVQVAVEGVDQLEIYFSAFLPQFFYAMLAPLTLFTVLCFINVKAAIVLLICVPIIPVSIAAVQTWAKKLLSKYWNRYTSLGDTFLENLQGLTTLKIYKSDEYRHQKMNEEAELFRKITMKVLFMQLNSITIMDLVAYGGAALGTIVAVTQFQAGNVGLAGCILIILLSADFFIPMRQLGSFFHVMMNGMAASDKIFALIDLPDKKRGSEVVSDDVSISCKDLSFSYDSDREILHKIDLDIKKNTLTAIVGESGSGKSTIASILMGKVSNYNGDVKISDVQLSSFDEDSILRNFTYLGHQSYIFKGTVRSNLLVGNESASEDMMWNVLAKVRLDEFVKANGGLDAEISERASNLSGGQRQRLAFARAILHDSPVYIFDEATSNIDAESENYIIDAIEELSKNHTIVIISHRLANVKKADLIYVLENGSIVESGIHNDLLALNKKYASLWNTQQELEQYRNEANVKSGKVGE